MKKILYLHAGAEFYGADKVLRDLIAGLDKSQFEAHVILPTKGILVEKLEEVGAKVTVLDYPILRRKYFNPRGILDYLSNYRRSSKEISRYVVEHDINVIHNNTTAVLEGIYVKKKNSIPLIWHVHEIIVKPKFISSFINMLMGVYVDKIVAVSNAVKDHIKTSKFIKKNQIQVIYNGVDNHVFKPKNSPSIKQQFGISAEKKIIGMVGRVNAWKGQKDFIEAVTPILKNNPNIVAFLAGGVFAGEEWRVNELEQLIHDSEIKNQIYRIDYYSNPAELYNMYDVFVLPSTNPDPLPTVVLEAMACSKPVVAYGHGGVTEMVKENYNGYFAEVNNPKDLESKIRNVILNDKISREFGENSLKRQMKYFSLESYVNNFSDVYNDNR